MRLGLFGTVSLAASLAVAAPLAIIGIELLRRGQPAVGAGFLVLAVLAFAFSEYVSRRIGGRFKGALGRVPLLGRRFR